MNRTETNQFTRSNNPFRKKNTQNETNTPEITTTFKQINKQDIYPSKNPDYNPQPDEIITSVITPAQLKIWPQIEEKYLKFLQRGQQKAREKLEEKRKEVDQLQSNIENRMREERLKRWIKEEDWKKGLEWFKQQIDEIGVTNTKNETDKLTESPR